MAIRKYKPTTPGRRGSSVADFAEITRSTPEKSLLRPLVQDRWPQQPGPHHDPSHRWWPQAPVPRHRLPSQRQGRHRRQGRPHRVRPQPHRAHRAPALRRRHEALHHRAEQAAAGRRRRVRCRRRHQAGQQPAAEATSRPVPSSTRSSSAGRRREDGPFGRCLGAPRRQGRPLRPAASALGRDPQRRCALPRDDRRGRQRRAVEHQLGQGRPQALEGHPPDRPRCRHEPGRPPARWW